MSTSQVGWVSNLQEEGASLARTYEAEVTGGKTWGSTHRHLLFLSIHPWPKPDAWSSFFLFCCFVFRLFLVSLG